MIVLWEPMYPGDARSKVPSALFDDPRVTSFWDPREISGAWFGQHPVGGIGGGIVWDAFYAFGGSARWTSAPSGVVATGAPVIAGTGALERAFVPLLR